LKIEGWVLAFILFQEEAIVAKGEKAKSTSDVLLNKKGERGCCSHCQQHK